MSGCESFSLVSQMALGCLDFFFLLWLVSVLGLGGFGAGFVSGVARSWITFPVIITASFRWSVVIG